MKEQEIKDRAKQHIESFVGYNDDDDLDEKIALFLEGFALAVQSMQKNDCISDVIKSEFIDSHGFEIQNLRHAKTKKEKISAIKAHARFIGDLANEVDKEMTSRLNSL